MIGYVKTRAELEALIEAESAGWLQRTDARTKEFRRKQRYEEASSLWSEVKAAYMRLQGGSKCAYCERKLEAVEFGKGEQAVDHFRPKRSVKAWPGAAGLARQGIPFAAAPPPGQGYYLLPYHPFNYVAACNPCNSLLKKDYFPIAGIYQLDADEPAHLQNEQPYLLYPIGDFDSAPETIIEFYGITPRPVAPTGHDRYRALVTIAFFRLGDAAGRKNLFLERAWLLLALFPQLERLRQPGSMDEQTAAKSIVEACMRSEMAHANCCRSFVRLFEQSPEEARSLYEAARRFVTSTS
ncbi:MAG: hypothetical protein JWL77_1565 [Chthonomonadaceae bacterium]|nr:hypothetical protein [Chthonomonadaceae bacterium]